MTERVFPIVPAGAGVYWVVGPVLVIFVIVTALLLYVTRGSRHAQFTVSAEGLRISGDLYGRLVPAASLELDRARVVSLKSETELQLTMRTNGSSMPGYRSGWFRLRNGEKALAFVTDQTRVAYIPTREGYALLLSTPDPAALIGALR